MRVKGAPITVDQRRPQLSFSQTPTAVPINGAKQLPQRISIIGIPRRRRRGRGSLLLCNGWSAVKALWRGTIAVVGGRGAAYAVGGAGIVAVVVAVGVVVCAWWGALLLLLLLFVALRASAVALFRTV